MRRLLLIACIMWTACGVRENTSDEADSVLAETTPFIDEADSTFIPAVDGPAIRDAVESLLKKQKQHPKSYLTLQVSASGSDYQTDGIWTFDSLLNLVHCDQKWVSEGAKGATQHYFQQDRLYAIKDENYDAGREELNFYHRELGGVRFDHSSNVNQDSTISPLERNFFTKSEQELKSTLSEIMHLLKDHQDKISQGDPATLKVEIKTKEKGRQEERTEIRVDRKLLTTLLR